MDPRRFLRPSPSDPIRDVLGARQTLSSETDPRRSRGDVKNPELLNRRTGKPERDGLYSAAIDRKRRGIHVQRSIWRGAKVLGRLREITSVLVRHGSGRKPRRGSASDCPRGGAWGGRRQRSRGPDKAN